MAYTRTIWQKGDVIDAEKLGNIENGIFAALNGLQHLTGKEYDRNKTDTDNLPGGINLSGDIAGENITATGNIAGGGNLTIGDRNNPNNKTTDLYTNTVNYGTFTVGTTENQKVTTLNGGLSVWGSSTFIHGAFKVGDESTPHSTKLIGPLTVQAHTMNDPELNTGVTFEVDTTIKENVIIGTATTENNVTTYTNTATFNANTTFNGNTIANGTLTIKDPTENLHAATKQYIDNIISNLDQQTITGFRPSKTLASLTESNGIISATFQDIEISESQVTNLTTDLNAKAPLASPTFTGTVTLAQDPQTSLEAATKQYVDTRAFKVDPEFSGTLLAKGNSNNFSLITDNEDPNNVYYSATINNDGILARTSIAVQNKTSSILTTCISYDGISFIQNNIPKNLISYNDMADMIIIGNNDLITSILGQQLLVSGNIITTIETTGNEDGKQGYIYDYSLMTDDRIGNLVLKCNGADDQSNALLNTPMLLSYQPWGFETGEVLSLGGPAMDTVVSNSNCVTDTYIRAKNSITLAPRNGRVNVKSDLSITSGNNLIMYNGTSQVTLSGEQLANLLALLNQSGGE